MKKLKYISLVMLSVMLLASCQSREGMIEQLVTSHLEQSLENPQNLKVLEIAQPDSALEQAYMMNTITDVTKVLMERTDYMTNPNLDDAYTMTLADLEMRMSSGLFSGMLGEAKKGQWSGWKVRVTYTGKSKYGCMYKAQRWYFLDKDCQTVIRHFDLPIVSTGKTEKVTNQKPKSKKKGQGGVSRIVLSDIK